MRLQNLCRVLGLSILCLATTLAASQSSLMYNFVHLGFQSSTAGINRWGDIAGDNFSNHTAFLYSHGILTTIAPSYSTATAINQYLQIALSSNGQANIYTPNNPLTALGSLGGPSEGYGINNSSAVVGQSFSSSDGQYHPFLYSNGQMTDLGTLGGPAPQCSANAINNNGGIVGSCFNAGNFQRAFRVVNGQVADIDARTADYDSIAYGINDAGDAVGYSNKASFCALRTTCRGATTNAVIFKNNGTITSIGTLGGPFAQAFSINSAGDVVGESQTANNGGKHAFLYTHGVLHDLNNATLVNGAGWLLFSTFAINDSGEIVALGISPTGQAETVILTPVPVYLSQLYFNPNAVVGGFSTTATVTLTRPAPPGGIVIQVGSNTSAVQFPGGNTVSISEGATSGSFTVNTSVVFQNTTATIWAKYNGITLNSFLVIYAYGV